MWDRLLDRFLRGLIVEDSLCLTYPNGDIRKYGSDTGKFAHVAIADAQALRALVLNPDLGLGEGYMNGKITTRNCKLDDVISILLRNRAKGRMPSWVLMANHMRYYARRFIQRNAPRAARKNVAHHYDISNEFYRLFLDDDMQYSCAYFSDPKMTLEQAQRAKKAHVAAKLQPEPGMRVLDIGCGWGGMALTLASDFGCDVTGITLSENQLAAARSRAEAMGLSQKVTFALQDYRNVVGSYDRVVSIGMLEHVGVPYHGKYFAKVSELLDLNGIALIHTIGMSAPPSLSSPWINKYIFPGGYIPCLSELAPAIEASGLWQSDIEILRLHYAKTLRHWRDRFEAHSAQIRNAYDERFVRMFRYYLTVCIHGFELQQQAVYQFQLARSVDAVPLTRDYLYKPAAQNSCSGARKTREYEATE